MLVVVVFVWGFGGILVQIPDFCILTEMLYGVVKVLCNICLPLFPCSSLEQF